MDLLDSKRVVDTILTVDRAATQELVNFVEDLQFRNPDFQDFFVSGYGGSGGKMTLRIKYQLLQRGEIQRTVIVSFVTDAGQKVAESSTVIVEKIPLTTS